MIENYREVENFYIENFSEKDEREDHIVFWDSKLPDMYAYNCILIKKNMKTSTIIEFVKEKLQVYKDKNKDFLKIILHPSFKINAELIDTLTEMKFDIQTNLYMKIDPKEYKNFRKKKECIIKKANNEETLEDGLKFDIESSIDLGMPKEFAKRKALRKKEVFKDSNKTLNLYICYQNGEPIGDCELHIQGKYGKIEDFDIIKSYQRKGFGTTLLKEVIHDAIKSGVKNLYLITDKEDTPKDMYNKLGFKIIGEEVEIFWSK